MAGRMMIRGQKTEDRRQRVGAAAPRLIISVETTGETTSHSTRLPAEELLAGHPKDGNQGAGYRLAKNAGQVIGYVFCLLSSVFCYAEDLPDPTRPPASIFAPAAGAGREATENQSSGLHTIIISETRRAAIIDGQTVELGGEHGDARLIEVNEGGVVLQRAQSRQVLTLFPDVKITQKETPDKESAEKESPNKESPNKEPPNKESLGK
jgi:MSHA biogenesis protein MshK